MNNIDDFNESLIEELKNIKIENEVDIYQIKIRKNHFYSGDLSAGDPIDTSVEITRDINDNIVMNVVHRYYDNNTVETKNEYSKVLDNGEELLKKINNLRLQDLKNNYFTDMVPESYQSWDIEYNYMFKIVGTFDQVISEYDELNRILSFDRIIEEELSKVNINDEVIGD